MAKLLGISHLEYSASNIQRHRALSDLVLSVFCGSRQIILPNRGRFQVLVIRGMGASLLISVANNAVFRGAGRLEQALGRRNCGKWRDFVLRAAFASLGGSVRSAMLRQGRCQADTRKPVRGFRRDGRVCLTPMLAMVCD